MQIRIDMDDACANSLLHAYLRHGILTRAALGACFCLASAELVVAFGFAIELADFFVRFGSAGQDRAARKVALRHDKIGMFEDLGGLVERIRGRAEALDAFAEAAHLEVHLLSRFRVRFETFALQAGFERGNRFRIFRQRPQQFLLRIPGGIIAGIERDDFLANRQAIGESIEAEQNRQRLERSGFVRIELSGFLERLERIEDFIVRSRRRPSTYFCRASRFSISWRVDGFRLHDFGRSPRSMFCDPSAEEGEQGGRNQDIAAP